jgi:hypothetical protein
MWTQEGRGSGVVHVASDLRAMREERNGQAGPGTHAAPDSHATT